MPAARQWSRSVSKALAVSESAEQARLLFVAQAIAGVHHLEAQQVTVFVFFK